jgi:xanthine dehydrogenase accessory factor
MLSLAERRRPFAVATVVDAEGSVPGKIGATMIVTDDGRAEGTVGGAGLEEKVKELCLAAIASGRGGLHAFDLAAWKPEGLDSVCGGTVHIAIQAYPPLPHLLLFGGGHCGKALADIAAPLDWDVTVVDGRAEFADAARFPQGTQSVVEDPAAFAATADLSDYSHAFLLGHAHDLDARTLKALLPRFGGFVGAIGSKAKWTHFRQRLLSWGVDERRVDAVVCPIGAPIGADTPEEIAVAVAAQVIESMKKQTRMVKVPR